MSDERWFSLIWCCRWLFKVEHIEVIFLSSESRELIDVVVFLIAVAQSKTFNYMRQTQNILYIWRFWLSNEPNQPTIDENGRNGTFHIQCVLLFSINSFKCYLWRPFCSFRFFFPSHFHFHEYSMRLSWLCSSCTVCAAFFFKVISTHVNI